VINSSKIINHYTLSLIRADMAACAVAVASAQADRNDESDN